MLTKTALGGALEVLRWKGWIAGAGLDGKPLKTQQGLRLKGKVMGVVALWDPRRLDSPNRAWFVRGLHQADHLQPHGGGHCNDGD